MTKTMLAFLIIAAVSLQAYGQISFQVCEWRNERALATKAVMAGKHENPIDCALFCKDLVVDGQRPNGAMAQMNVPTMCTCLFGMIGFNNTGEPIFSCFLKQSQAHQIAAEVPKAEHFTSIRFTNKTLIKHTSRRFLATSLPGEPIENCFKLCLKCRLYPVEKCKCLSQNIFRENGQIVCEMNDATVEQFPGDLVEREGSQYYRVA